MISKLVKLVLLSAVVALALGAYLGTKVPYGDSHLSTTDVAGKLENTEGLALADEKDGDEQFTFQAGTVFWADDATSGHGDPPCLRTVGRMVDFEVGYTTVATPDGLRHDNVVLWVRCP